uniref:Uncharacterized protein n=1 Tax=Siphoviridae sp. ctfYP22 TaxID=2827584 RepID=A0A8S5LIB2_9CAUD|nr:MAG TPA: hypothetical protein [Siphoviridae sp. ctfYP22]
MERERTQKAPRSFHNGRRGYHFFNISTKV